MKTNTPPEKDLVFVTFQCDTADVYSVSTSEEGSCLLALLVGHRTFER